MRVFQQATQEDHAVKEQVVVAQQQQQEQEAMDMDADDAMLFESLLQDPEGAS